MNQPSNRGNQNIPNLSSMQFFNQNQNFQTNGYNMGMPQMSPQMGIGMNYENSTGFPNNNYNQVGINTSNEFNTSTQQMNNMNQFGMGTMGTSGQVNTQYALPFMTGNMPDMSNRTAYSYTQPGINMININNNANNMNNPMTGRILQQNMNLSNSILAQINQQNMEKLNRIKDEEDANLKQVQEEKEFKKRFEVEWKKFMLTKEEMEMIKPMGDGISMNRSEHFYDRDRFFFEELIQAPLKTEGCLGMNLVSNLDKSKLYSNKEEDPQSALITTFNYFNNKMEKDFFDKMAKDGIYLDYVKNTIDSYNLQKVEQRALREDKLDWFKFNGDLRLENDIFDDVITVPTDISLSTNDKFNMHILNNSMCARSTERKLKFFKIKIFLSKLYFKFHPLFNDEEILCSELKEFYNDYYKQMNMMNIPYHKEKIFTMSRQLEEYSKIKIPSEAVNLEIRYMKLFVEESIKFLENEKKNLNHTANLLYGKWTELKRLRETQKFQSTNLKLSVLKFTSTDEENSNIFDYAFILSLSELSTQEIKFIPKTEHTRRLKIQKLQCFLKIYINGVFVADTKKSFLTWPNFEIDLSDLIQINVYSRPTKIELQLYIGSYTFNKVAQFEIEPPGIFSNTITSSSTLLEEVAFDSNPNEGNNLEKKQEASEQSSTLNIMKDSLQGNKEENEKLLIVPVDKSKSKTKVDIKSIYKGKVLLKVEWEGQAADMPPTKTEDKMNLIKKQNLNREQTSLMNRHDYPYDINDPRNVAYFEQMKKIKTELLLRYLNKEYMLPFHDVKSNRHFLLRKRQEKMSLKNLKIPILETELEKSEVIRKAIKELDNDKVETEEEHEKRVKTELRNLEKIYSGNTLTEEDYMNMLTKKIKTLKKDIVNKLQMSYFQIVSEFFYSSNWKSLLKNSCFNMLIPARKLAPSKKKKSEAKIEMIKEIKITVHIVKGYNMPVRNESIPAIIRDQIKSHAISQVYKSGAGSNFGGQMVSNQLLKREIANKGMENILLEMQNQNINGNINLNNSGAFGNPNNISGNHSLIGGINVNMNDMNMNINTPYNYGGNIPGYQVAPGNNFNFQNMPQNINPNLQNVMFNPNQPNMMYNNPSNLLYNQVSMPSQIKNYEGDILEMIEILKGVEKIVESFVQVNMNYHDQECEIRTESVDGLHPDYNSKMRFTIKPKNGKTFFTTEELTKCQGSFYFNLYDELRTQQKIQEKDANTYIYRYEKKFLGSFKIPFTTLLQNAHLLESVCKINVPPTLFGYYSDASSTYDIFQDKEEELKKSEVGKKVDNHEASKSSLRLTDNVNRIVNPFISTYLSLYITMDPVPGFLSSDDIDYVPGFEDSVFLINTTKWLKNLRANIILRERNIKLLVENFDGYSIFVSRYLAAAGQKPPEIIFDEVNNPMDEFSIEKAARFVSLISFVEDCQAFDNEEMPDCWCTDEQFLTLAFGDYEEHAILLCNYFNYIDRQQNRNCSSYIVLGKGYPEGMTTYVMRVSNTSPDVEFWNAKKSECFYFDKRYQDNKFLCFTVSRSFKTTKNSSNTICSLKEIGCIITPDNVYINLQASGDPGFIDFNLKNSSNWKPFLNESSKKKYFPEGIATIQKELRYEYPTSQESYQLSKKIYEYLKKEIEISRYSLEHNGKPLRTRWDRAASEKIELILAEYDLFYFSQKQSGINIVLSGNDVAHAMNQIQDEVMEKLKNIQYRMENEFVGVRQIYGFPVNVSYTALNEIWREIKLTETHLVDDENCELSLSVHVNGYPSKVYSVWVFFAVLRK